MCGVWRVHSHNGRGAPARPRPRSLYQLMSAAVCVQEVLVNFAQSSVESAEEGALVGGASWRDAVRLDAYTVARKRRAGGKDELGGLPIVRRGRVELGSSTTGTATFAVNFDGEELLASEPIVLVHPRMQKGGDPSWQDIYVAEVQSVSTSGFTVNVARLDKLDNSGWGQQVRLDYIAWLPGTGDTERYRSGEVTVGKSHGLCAVRLTVNFPTPFADGAQPRVLCSPRCQPNHDFTDAHAVVVHEAWNGGFNATVTRVDRLGEGWGSKVLLSWVAWVA